MKLQKLVIIAAILGVILICGCINEKESDNELTAQELLKKSVLSNTGDAIKSYKVDMRWEINMQNVINANTNTQAVFDPINKKTYAHYTHVSHVSTQAPNETEIKVRALYIINDTLYSNKQGIWEIKNISEERQIKRVQLDQSIKEIMEENIDILFAHEESLDGVPCYVLCGRMKPEHAIRAVDGFFKGTISGGERYKYINASVKIWIAKDSYLLMKFIKDISVEVNGVPTYLRNKREYYEYNKPVDIGIPDEIKWLGHFKPDTGKEFIVSIPQNHS